MYACTTHRVSSLLCKGLSSVCVCVHVCVRACTTHRVSSLLCKGLSSVRACVCACTTHRVSSLLCKGLSSVHAYVCVCVYACTTHRVNSLLCKGLSRTGFWKRNAGESLRYVGLYNHTKHTENCAQRSPSMADFTLISVCSLLTLQ